MDEKINDNNLNNCDECKTEYFAHSSLMKGLCPECAHILYGYDRCDHQLAKAGLR